jgi:hypothetical protein
MFVTRVESRVKLQKAAPPQVARTTETSIGQSPTFEFLDGVTDSSDNVGLTPQ